MRVTCPIERQRLGKDLTSTHNTHYEVRSRTGWKIHSFDTEEQVREWHGKRNINALQIVRVTTIEELI